MARPDELDDDDDRAERPAPRTGTGTALWVLLAVGVGSIFGLLFGGAVGTVVAFHGGDDEPTEVAAAPVPEVPPVEPAPPPAPEPPAPAVAPEPPPSPATGVEPPTPPTAVMPDRPPTPPTAVRPESPVTPPTAVAAVTPPTAFGTPTTALEGGRLSSTPGDTTGAMTTTPASAASPARVIPLPPRTAPAWDVVFAGGPDGAAAVAGYPPGRIGPRPVNVVRLGRTGKPTPVPIAEANPDMLAVSPDGGQVAVATGTGQIGGPFSLNIYPVGGGPAARLTPYPATAGAARGPNLAAVSFLGPDRLLTVSDTGGFDVWAVPGVGRLGGRPGPFAGNSARVPLVHKQTKAPTQFSRSENGKVLALYDGKGFNIYSTDTMARLALTDPLAPAGQSVILSATALTADGAKLAAVFLRSPPTGPVGVVAVWDAKTGQRLSEQPLSHLYVTHPEGMQWWGPDRLLFWQGLNQRNRLTRADVWSVPDARLVGHVETGPRCSLAVGGPGDRLWATAGGPLVNGPGVLLSLDPPSFGKGSGLETTLYVTRDGLSPTFPGGK